MLYWQYLLNFNCRLSFSSFSELISHGQVRGWARWEADIERDVETQMRMIWAEWGAYTDFFHVSLRLKMIR